LSRWNAASAREIRRARAASSRPTSIAARDEEIKTPPDRLVEQRDGCDLAIEIAPGTQKSTRLSAAIQLL